MAFNADLKVHLDQLPAAPFLFAGAGLSRRYLGLDGWEALLRRYAEVAGKPFEYYAASADGDFPKIASLIAADLHEPWWNDASFEDSRELYKDVVHGSQSALKAEVSKGLRDCLDSLPKSGALAKELDQLRGATVDGVITTNYDPLIEHVFPEYEVFVGQDQMLFANPQGIGEIYKIHGSCEAPDSLVLTAEDYERFNERNAYLAAKLLTVFVEHPVVFLGYSLSDRNVFQIIRSIASVLTNDRIGELQDRLIFIEWDENAKNPALRPIPFVADAYTVPMLGATVSDYKDVFEVLGSVERRFSARMLRQLKERVYELVRTNDPKEKLYVQDLEPDADAAEVEVVLGVGAIEKQLARSYKGLNRDDLAEDVVTGGTGLDPRRVLTEVLPFIQRNVHCPVFKYLREAGLLEDDGTLKDKKSVHERVAYRVDHYADHFRIPSGYEQRAKAAVEAAGDFKGLVANCKAIEVLMFAIRLPDDKQDPAALKRFLERNREPESGDATWHVTQWNRGVCLYDWLQHGRRAKPARRRRRVGQRSARARRPAKK
jgi:SIR2-like domain